MPEIAECKIFTEQLSQKFKGSSLLDLCILGGKFLKEPIKNLGGVSFPLTNVSFHSKGKFLYWKFDDGVYFFITLGMTGGFGAHQKHSHLQFKFDNGSIYFNDPRHFGTFRAILSQKELEDKLNTLGWDPLQEPDYDLNLVVANLRKHNHRTIAEELLNQRIFAGLGNYLRSEILYDTQIAPLTLIGELADEDLLRICRSYKRIAEEAYQHKGTTLADFSDLEGKKGEHKDFLKVYRKKLDPLGRKVMKMSGPEGRSIYYV